MLAYYNDNDPIACAAMKALMAEGWIPPGDVDDRSIADVKPADLRGYTHLHFFAGQGTWAYALRLAGWPDDRPVATASLPCQPFSSAGKRKGEKDERHLWPVFFRLVRECGFDTLLGEQVASKAALAWWDRVSDDLEGAGYRCGAFDLPACCVGAPHIRQRLFWVAESASCGHTERVNSDQAEAKRTPLGDKSVHQQNQGCRRTNLADDRNAGGAEPGRPVGPAAAGFWADSIPILCRDGKARRIPAQSVLLGVVDRSAAGLGDLLPERGFPLAVKVEGRTAMLRLIGNSIVAALAAEFVAAYMAARDVRGEP